MSAFGKADKVRSFVHRGVLQWVDDDSPIGCGKPAVHQTAGLRKNVVFSMMVCFPETA
jgi:hypothetical protein